MEQKNIFNINSFELYINYKNYRDEIIKDNYKEVENLILLGKVSLVKIILMREDISELFIPGFKRKNDIKNRMLPQYLFLIISSEMKEILLTSSSILEMIYKYNNELISPC